MELKDLLEATGIEAEDLDTFKQKLGEKYISRQVHDDEMRSAKSAHGESYGKVTTKAKQTFKSLGVEFEEGELKDKDVNEILELGTAKMSKRLEDLSNEAKNNTPDLDKIRSGYEEKINKITTERDEARTFLETVKTEKEELEKNMNGKLKDFKVNRVVTDSMSGITWKDGITEVERKGFDAVVSSKYDFDIDEDDNVYPVNKADGKRVQDTQGYLSIEDVLSNEAKTLGLRKENGARRTPVTQSSATGSPTGGGGNEPRQREVHPNAAR